MRAPLQTRSRAKHTWPAILGFLIGCALGGACEAALGLKSVVLPSSLAVLAVGLGLAPYLHHAEISFKVNSSMHLLS